MVLWELSFRGRFDTRLGRTSVRIPGRRFYAGRFGHRTCLWVPSPDLPAMRGLVRALRESGLAVEREVATPATYLVVVDEGAESRPVGAIVESNGCREVSPWMYEEGWAYFQVQSVDERSSHRLFEGLRVLGPVELLRKIERPIASLAATEGVNGVLEDLTALQLAALVHARRQGYYTIPRTTTTAELARQRGVVRSTFEQHLRRGENKVLEAVMGQFELRQMGSSTLVATEPVPSGEDPGAATGRGSRGRGRPRRRDTTLEAARAPDDSACGLVQEVGAVPPDPA